MLEALADDTALQDLQGNKERRGAVALVVPASLDAGCLSLGGGCREPGVTGLDGKPVTTEQADTSHTLREAPSR